MKNGLKDIIGKQITAVVVAQSDRAPKQQALVFAGTPAPTALEQLLSRDLVAWREAKAAIAKAMGRSAP